MSGTPEDEKLEGLIERAQVGDPAAFEDIVRILERPLLGFARAHGAPDPDAVTNEVLLRAFRGIVMFDGAAPQFRAWIYRIARNLIIDEQRAAARRPVSFPVEPARVPEVAELSSEDRLDEIERVTSLLAGIPTDQREVLVLRIVAGLNVAEVADVLGKRPGAVRALQHRGLERLRHELSRES